jgi:hypothetical protein
MVCANGSYVPSMSTSTGGCLPSEHASHGCHGAPTYEVRRLAAFFGPERLICENATARADIVSYGFTGLASCGLLTGGDCTARRPGARC